MYKHRINAKTDNNQKDIVKSLRQIPGVSVEVGHDDILVGGKDKTGKKRTYWFEIKASEKAEIKPSQVKLLAKYKGHYSIVWELDQILREVGII